MESNPDIDIVLIIANYFGITTDELFVYQNNRDNIVKYIIDTINSFNIKSKSNSDWIDDCLRILKIILLNVLKINVY